MNDLNLRAAEPQARQVSTHRSCGYQLVDSLEAPRGHHVPSGRGHIVIPYEGGAYGRSRSDAFGNAGLADSGHAGWIRRGRRHRPAHHALPTPSSTRGRPRIADESDHGPAGSMDMDLLHTRVNGDRHANQGHRGTPAPRSIAIIPSGGSIRRAQQRLGRLGGAGLLRLGCAGRAWVDLRWVVSGAGVLRSASPVGWGGCGCLDCAPDRSAALAWATTPRAARLERVRRRAARLLPRDSRAASWAVPARVGRRTTRRSVVAAGMRAFRVEDGGLRACRADTSIPSRRPMAPNRTMTPAKRKDDGWDISQW